MEEKAADVIEALRTRGGWIGELVAQGKGGTPFDVQIAASMVMDAAGQPMCMQASFADITDRKRAEDERRNLGTKLQRAQKMEAFGLMAGGVAHDLNNMLSAIVNLPELILMDIPKEDQKLRRRMQMIMSSGEKISTIVDDLAHLHF